MTQNDTNLPTVTHKTPVQYFSLIMGIAFLAVGVLGFIPGVNVMYGHEHMQHNLNVTASQGYLLGLFPVNVLHNAVHLLFGVWGLVAFSRFAAARVYAGSVAVIYFVLAIAGLIPSLNTLFGLVPIYGNDVWLHGLIAIAAAAFAFAPARFLHDEETFGGHTHTPHHA
jgi:hypothetical protein